MTRRRNNLGVTTSPHFYDYPSQWIEGRSGQQRTQDVELLYIYMNIQVCRHLLSNPMSIPRNSQQLYILSPFLTQVYPFLKTLVAVDGKRVTGKKSL